MMMMTMMMQEGDAGGGCSGWVQGLDEGGGSRGMDAEGGCKILMQGVDAGGGCRRWMQGGGRRGCTGESPQAGCELLTVGGGKFDPKQMLKFNCGYFGAPGPPTNLVGGFAGGHRGPKASMN